MFIVKFVRADGKPTEEYYYHLREDAQHHVELFACDDSGLYTSIELEEINI